MSKANLWDEVRFFTMGETMGMHYRDQVDSPISKERAERSAHQAAPSLEAFSFPKYREAFISGFLRGCEYIEIRASMMRSAETYGTAHE